MKLKLKLGGEGESSEVRDAAGIPPAPEAPGTPIRVEESEALCRTFARAMVGRLGLKEAQGMLRDEMYAEALARSGGSRRGAARVLGINRRCVQRLAAELEETGTTRARANGTQET